MSSSWDQNLLFLSLSFSGSSTKLGAYTLSTVILWGKQFMVSSAILGEWGDKIGNMRS